MVGTCFDVSTTGHLCIALDNVALCRSPYSSECTNIISRTNKRRKFDACDEQHEVSAAPSSGPPSKALPLTSSSTSISSSYVFWLPVYSPFTHIV